MSWSINDSRDLYNVDGWGIGYFGINEDGHVTVHPTKEVDRGLDLSPKKALINRLVGGPTVEANSDSAAAVIQPVSDESSLVVHQLDRLAI